MRVTSLTLESITEENLEFYYYFLTKGENEREIAKLEPKVNVIRSNDN